MQSIMTDGISHSFSSRYIDISVKHANHELDELKRK